MSAPIDVVPLDQELTPAEGDVPAVATVTRTAASTASASARVPGGVRRASSSRKRLSIRSE
jgi:H+/Cl- antiporter ClcA